VAVVAVVAVVAELVVAGVAVVVVVVVVVVESVLVAEALAGGGPVLDVPVEAAGVPPELPHDENAVAPSTAKASSHSIRFVRRCSGIAVVGPSPGFQDPKCVPVSRGRHGP
jgi:hypothetical protein